MAEVALRVSKDRFDDDGTDRLVLNPSPKNNQRIALGIKKVCEDHLPGFILAETREEMYGSFLRLFTLLYCAADSMGYPMSPFDDLYASLLLSQSRNASQEDRERDGKQVEELVYKLIKENPLIPQGVPDSFLKNAPGTQDPS